LNFKDALKFIPIMAIRILHTADWHLGKVFEGMQFDLIDEQRRILNKIKEIASNEDVHLVIVSGDVFDSYVPSNAARKAFFDVVVELTDDGRRPVIVIAGNHDSPEGLTAANAALSRHGVVVFGTPVDPLPDFELETKRYRLFRKGRFVQLEFSDSDESLCLQALPYASETRLREALESEGQADRAVEYAQRLRLLLCHKPPFASDRYVIAAHLYMGGGEEVGSERRLMLGTSYHVPVDYLPSDVDYVALGHLHKSQAIAPNVHYSGSIFPLSIFDAEKDPMKSVLLVALEDRVSVERIPVLEEGRVVVMRPESISEALSQAEKLANSLVFMEFFGVIPKPTQIEQLRRAYRRNLLGIRFVFEPEKSRMDVAELRKLEPVEIFKRYYRLQHGVQPSSELVKLFVEILDEVGMS